jgi:hypothetical protein
MPYTKSDPRISPDATGPDSTGSDSPGSDSTCTFASEASAALACAAPSDRVVMGLLYMLVQLSTRGACRHVILGIGGHLEMLARHRDASPALRTTALQLRDHWMRCIAVADRQAGDEGGVPHASMH